MSARRSPRKATEKASDVIELSSDSEPEAPEVEEVEHEGTEPVSTSPDANDQPLLRAAGIKYKTDISDHEEEEPQEDGKHSPSSAKLSVRVKDTGSVKHRHVSIEIPLPTSSALQRRRAEAEATDSQEGNDDEVFKTPMERKHITFDDSDHDEFVTPREDPLSNPLENSIARPNTAKAEAEEEEEEEESDDDAPPEAVSTRAAEAYNLKAAEVAEQAVKQQAAALKRKRQERDTFFKQQAEERKRTQKPTRLDEEADDASPSTKPTPERAEKKRREVPKLLPLELLESDDEDDVSQQPSSSANGNNKRRKLGGAEHRLLAEPKLPRDKRLGSTAYRVVKGKGNTKLAPKVKQQAVNLKETLLRRDRVAQPRGGFFVNRR